MSSVAEIRRHIGAVNDTAKITRAMQLISSAKMRKAMQLHDNNLQYFQRARSVIRFLLENSGGEEIQNPYFVQRPGKRAAFLVITADKGLCGGYNMDILHLAEKAMEDIDYNERFLFTIGYVGSDYFQRKGLHPDINYLHIIQDPSLKSARAITYELETLFNSDLLDEVYVVYTELKRMGVLRPRVLRLLPILPEDFSGAELLHTPTNTLNYHPGLQKALDDIVPHYLIGLVYSALVQAFASEQSARMAAMDAATRNAEEMLQKLSLELNHARQTVITQEITEIISGNPDQGGVRL